MPARKAAAKAKTARRAKAAMSAPPPTRKPTAKGMADRAMARRMTGY